MVYVKRCIDYCTYISSEITQVIRIYSSTFIIIIGSLLVIRFKIESIKMCEFVNIFDSIWLPFFFHWILLPFGHQIILFESPSFSDNKINIIGTLSIHFHSDFNVYFHFILYVIRIIFVLFDSHLYSTLRTNENSKFKWEKKKKKKKWRKK